MNLFPACRSALLACAALAGTLILAGCWGWIPEDPVAPGPAPGTAGGEAPAPAAKPAQRGVAARPAQAPETYRVVSGDTLFAIAWRFRLTVSDLAAWNKLGDGTLIFVGQRLRLTPPPDYAGAAGVSAGPGTAATRTSPAAGKAAASGAGSRVAARPRPGTEAAASGSSSQGSGTLPASGTAAPSRPATGGGAWRWPAEGRVDTKGARVRSDDYGIRIMGQQGQNVYATDSGKVMYAGDGLKAYGLLVIVQHSSEWLSAYGHNERILVREGDEVKAGQPIATMGVGPANTPMLHFEIRRNGKPVEPMGLLPPRN